MSIDYTVNDEFTVKWKLMTQLQYSWTNKIIYRYIECTQMKCYGIYIKTELYIYCTVKLSSVLTT